MKKIIALLLALIMCVSLFACEGAKDKDLEEDEETNETVKAEGGDEKVPTHQNSTAGGNPDTGESTSADTGVDYDSPVLPGYISINEYNAIVDKYEGVQATITVKDFGSIKLELYPEYAPVSAKNFVDLAESGFYEGIIFHRVIKDFMIQGGDPNGIGTGGSGKNIFGEFAYNGYNNPISHERGVISMARSSAYNSASSQFFICHKDSTYLDNQYAAFGRVIEGMEVVDAIAAVETNASDKPLTDVVIEKIEITYAK